MPFNSSICLKQPNQWNNLRLQRKICACVWVSVIQRNDFIELNWTHRNHHLIYIVFSNIFALSIELHKNPFWYIHSIESASSLFFSNIAAFGMTKCDFVKYLCHCLIERLSELIYLFVITFFIFLFKSGITNEVLNLTRLQRSMALFTA